MKQCGIRFPFVAAALMAIALATPLAAQSRLYVLDSSDGQFHRVLKISDDKAYITGKAGVVASEGRQFVLKAAEEFLPCYIDVSHKQVDLSSSALMGQAPSLYVGDNKVHFAAEFVSAFFLDDVFLVLELQFADGLDTLVARGVGRLEPGVPLKYSQDIGVQKEATLRRYALHLFANGSEVFTSEVPAAFREEKIVQMIKVRLASVRQAGPKPLYCPPPSYPETLKKSGVKGRAVVTIRITPEGGVFDPVVESASDPAFGEAALSAVRAWRFVPGVKGGQPVEARASIPFGFDPSVGQGR